MLRNVDDLPAASELKKFLEAPNVKIRDWPTVESKLRRIINGGVDKLMVRISG